MKHRMGLEAAGGQPPDPRDIWIKIKDKRGAFILILISSGVSRLAASGLKAPLLMFQDVHHVSYSYSELIFMLHDVS